MVLCWRDSSCFSRWNLHAFCVSNTDKANVSCIMVLHFSFRPFSRWRLSHFLVLKADEGRRLLLVKPSFYYTPVFRRDVLWYTPVFRRDVLWYGDVRPGSPSVRLSVRPSGSPSVRPPARFPHFSPTYFDILSWNFVHDFVLMYYRSSSTVITLRQFLKELCLFVNLEYR